MEQILYKLLEQTPTIIALGLGIYALWNERVRERKEHQMSIDKLVQDHRKELRDVNSYMRDREKENMETLKDIRVLLEQIANEK